MNLTDNFARSFRVCGLYFTTPAGTLNVYDGKRKKHADISMSGKPRISIEMDTTTDAELLRAIDGAMAPGQLALMLGADSDESSWFYRGIADRLRRAYVEPDAPQGKYEAPLKAAAKTLFLSALKVLNYEVKSLTVRRAQSKSCYSPIVGEANVVLPETGMERRVQLVADPSPINENGWCLSANAYGFSVNDMHKLHSEFPQAINTLQTMGFDFAPLPWIGQSY